MSEEQIFSSFWKFLNEQDNPSYAIEFRNKLTFLLITWLQEKTSWSERAVATQLGVSNTRVGQIKASYQSKVKFESGKGVSK